MKARALQPAVPALTSALKSVIKERAGTPPLPLAVVLIYEYITTVDHRGWKRVSMGFLLECSYKKCSVAQAQGLLYTSRSRWGCFTVEEL